MYYYNMSRHLPTTGMNILKKFADSEYLLSGACYFNTGYFIVNELFNVCLYDILFISWIVNKKKVLN